jgi:hypothetical protein
MCYKNQLTDAIKPIYLHFQQDRHVGFANKSLQEFFTSLVQAYGKLTPQTLMDNQTSMQTPWDPNTPFETLIKKLRMLWKLPMLPLKPTLMHKSSH